MESGVALIHLYPAPFVFGYTSRSNTGKEFTADGPNLHQTSLGAAGEGYRLLRSFSPRPGSYNITIYCIVYFRVSCPGHFPLAAYAEEVVQYTTGSSVPRDIRGPGCKTWCNPHVLTNRQYLGLQQPQLHFRRPLGSGRVSIY
jgi:hypothetical protein